MVNLISNSLKAILAGNGKRLLIEGEGQNGWAYLRVYDDGIGLKKDQRERVLSALVADPDGRLYSGLEQRIKDDDLVALGRGSGIGLSIVSDIVHSCGGSIKFIDVEKPWNTCIEVKIK